MASHISPNLFVTHLAGRRLRRRIDPIASLCSQGADRRKINNLAWASVAAEMGQVKLPEPTILSTPFGRRRASGRVVGIARSVQD